MLNKDELTATVIGVIREGSPYAVAESEDVLDVVTFSLEKNRGVWSDADYPTVGSTVILGDVRKTKRGWRAYAARFYRPSDENA